MILVFEGHDNSGKSTIAQAYAKRFGGQYYHNPSNQDAIKEHVPLSYQEYYLALHLPCFDQRRLHVIDRFVMSDYVYSDIFGTPINKKWRDESYRISQPYVRYVVCYKTGDIVKDNLFDKQELVRQRYMSFMDDPMWPNAFFIDTTDENLEHQLRAIRGYQLTCEKLCQNI